MANMAKQVLTDTFSEPLNNAKTAKIHIDSGNGNLIIDRLIGDEQVLFTGTLQYLTNQEKPTRTLVSKNNQATLTVERSGRGQRLFRFPWSACNGATTWNFHLNSRVSSDLIAHSDGGNIRLDLSGMDVTSIMTDTGGGNIDIVLPEDVTNLSVTAKTSAGNLTTKIGSSLKGSNIVNAKSGAGNVIVQTKLQK